MNLMTIESTTLEATSYLGARYEGNVQRLLDVDVAPLLAGFQSKPGTHPWIGEHIGKWMDAASLVVRTTSHPKLRAKLEDVTGQLIDAQEADGYLGTYREGQRFGLYEGADWDVWAHKYCMIGLLASYCALNDPRPLEAARRAADLLVATFYDPGDRDILKAGTHMGMAATSVLQPIVELYAITGEPRYLDFAHGILRSWKRPAGPRILSTLLGSGQVNEVGNGKAYEMLSNLVGLAEFARVTGEREPLTAVTRAWDDIVQHHLYLTGTMSHGEHFHEPDQLPDSTSVNMGETCVTVTWMQLTHRLFAMTGGAQYSAEIERTYFNHLAAAQTVDGSGWCYYTPLGGAHDYGSGVSCCISSGPRGVALVPHLVFAWDGESVVVAQYAPATATLKIEGRSVTVALQTDMPYKGGARLTVSAEDGREVVLGVRWRIPAWVNDIDASDVTLKQDGWAIVPPRAFRADDAAVIDFDLGLGTVQGRGSNTGRIAYTWGPLVLAYETDGDAPALFDVAISDPCGIIDAASVRLNWSVANRFSRGGARAARVGPFASVAASNTRSRVWIATGEPELVPSAFHGAQEIRSSGDLDRGSVADYDRAAFAETSQAPVESEAWFGLKNDSAVTFQRILVAHGRSMVHGGWFDTTPGRPRIEIQQAPNGEWATLLEIAGYPEADAVWDGGLTPGEPFEIDLTVPVTAYGIRVIGRGSYGEYPRSTRFATCSRLEAFDR